MIKILVIEDEHRLADTLHDLLAANQYSAELCYDGESGFNAAVSGAFDVIILDIMLPRLNGFELVQKLRLTDVKTPVLMLTAKTEVADRISGLDCGADYYLTKPFDTNELLACIRSLLRRQGEGVSEAICYGDLSLHTSTCMLRCNGHEIRLSSKEYEIIRLLLLNGKRIVSKESILKNVWGQDSDAEDNHVEVYISFLRKKLALIKSSVAIATVRKAGYYLEVSADA